jgi:hypothetical protein
MDDETRRLLEIREIDRRRLHALDRQHALLGVSTPPEILIEIETLRKKLGLFEAVLTSSLSSDVLTQIGPHGQYQALDSRLDQLDRRFTEGLDRLAEQFAGALDRIEERFAWNDQRRNEQIATLNEQLHRSRDLTRQLRRLIAGVMMSIIALALIFGAYAVIDRLP